ncbi:CCA tRNA nucleotidyltransferase [Sutcliffiella deserti]|uniref:CCA tRNA nucleotidyltransferase n=1 Tax=Sutcliffiella deserti TaxID=2875501 RepID=UPI001CC1677E|nr:CCA tRNA nucleotidyltransferase [Sutcliffiella deserti]
MNQAFKHAIPIISTLEKHGHEALFVGGSVRDYLMDREIGDIDIATSAFPKQIQALFPKTIDVGAEHGTIIVVEEENTYEVTTFRADGTYSDKRRPDVVTFVTNLEEDLKRRDFTMNAIAMTKDGTIIDPYSGKDAIKGKLIQTVGEASERFHEDALRMLRALRFSSQLSFSIHQDTFQAVKDYAHFLQDVSVERKTVEFEKLLKGQGLNSSLHLLVESGIYRYLPFLENKKDELLKLSILSPTVVNERELLWTAIAYILQIKDVEAFLDAWKLPKKLSKAVKDNIFVINRFLKEDWHQALIYHAGWKSTIAAHQVLVLVEMDKPESYLYIKQLYDKLPIYSLRDIELNGNDLVECLNRKPGKWIAEVLQEIEQEILLGSLVNEASVLKEWVRSWQQK